MPSQFRQWREHAKHHLFDLAHELRVFAVRIQEVQRQQPLAFQFVEAQRLAGSIVFGIKYPLVAGFNFAMM
jgi:hypothetical protein